MQVGLFIKDFHKLKNCFHLLECTDWSGWTECSKSCGGGFKERYHTCGNFQQEIESIECSTQPCVTDILCMFY